jgi:hypothetical protein
MAVVIGDTHELAGFWNARAHLIARERRFDVDASYQGAQGRVAGPGD